MSRITCSATASVTTGAGAHAAGVGSAVALVAGLVVLRCRERQQRAAIRDGDEARLLALEKCLDDDLAAGLPEARIDEHLARRIHGGPDRVGDHDALAGREAVGLDHDRRTLPLDVLARGVEVREARECRGGDGVSIEKGLRE